MAVRIVTDSTCDLPEEFRRRHGVVVVPLRLHFGEETYRDRVDISDQEFVRRLEGARQPPSTSQPPPGDFEEVYRELLQGGADGVVSIHIAAAIWAADSPRSARWTASCTKNPVAMLTVRLSTTCTRPGPTSSAAMVAELTVPLSTAAMWMETTPSATPNSPFRRGSRWSGTGGRDPSVGSATPGSLPPGPVSPGPRGW